MTKDLTNTFILAGSFLALFALAEVLYHFLKIKAELTRKLVHFGTGILTLLFPVLLDNSWLVLALCTSFALILFVSLRYDLLKSINAIDRKSYGSLCYPLAVYVCYLFYEWYKTGGDARGGYLIFYLPILTLAISDPAAALTGKTWPIGKYKVGQSTRTLSGSSAFFFTAVLLSLGLVSYGFEIAPFGIPLFAFTLLYALGTTVAEAISQHGLDNLLIPVSGALITYYSLSYLL